ncbi:hypothetical protein [Methylorubrum sp. SB2]|uniref:hypothetical protein n=1 Tax=Methylorubrum subtropicum TaxID=3138812 RepID=UPI00313C76E5
MIVRHDFNERKSIGLENDFRRPGLQVVLNDIAAAVRENIGVYLCVIKILSVRGKGQRSIAIAVRLDGKLFAGGLVRNDEIAGARIATGQVSIRRNKTVAATRS